jgi:hypothetical protein
MAAMTISGQSYLGSTGILRPDARVHPEANATGELAKALADAWQMAETRGGIPHVDEVGNDGEGLVVLGDLLTTGRLAWDALAIADTCLP